MFLFLTLLNASLAALNAYTGDLRVAAIFLVGALFGLLSIVLERRLGNDLD